jgi:predicted DNA-binding transcriptional regulator AlpA
MIRRSADGDQRPERLLNLTEAASALGVSTSFLAKARMTGEGPSFIKLGRTVRYSQRALDEYRLRRTRQSTSQI